MSNDSDNSIKLEALSPLLRSRTSIGDTLSQASTQSLSSSSLPSTPPKLVRNARADCVYDYVYIFKKLQLSQGFYLQFFQTIKQYRSREDVRRLLADPDEDVTGISEDFLNTYGGKIWMRRGLNNQQDTKHRETYFKWTDDQDRLWSILDQLWKRVRQLLWSPRSPSPELSSQTSSTLCSSGSMSSISSLDSEEEAVVVEFINKVRRDIHGLPGNVLPRKRIYQSIEYE